MKVLFLNQGRARPDAAMGVVRVQDAIELGRPSADGELEFAVVPEFNRLQWALAHGVGPFFPHDFRVLRWHLVRSWMARRLLARRLRRDRPDVVHVSTDQVSLLLGGLTGRTPCVLALDIPIAEWTKLQRHLPADAPTPVDLKPLVALERRALERAALCIAWTETVAEGARRIAPRARVRVLHPGIDLEEFRPATGPRRPGPIRVLFVGGRWSEKGGPELLEALADDLGDSLELQVVSPADIPLRPGVTRHRTRPGSSDTAELFRQADVFCLPTRFDGAPQVIVEALASGVPVVSTSIGSIPELVGDAGTIVAPGDVEALRSAVLRLAQDAELRAEMSRAGRARAEERYDARRNTPELLSILQEVSLAP